MLLEIGLVFAVFVLQAAWPVPDVNESVYLAKIKHAWNPQWAAGDLYLGSTDAHQVFTYTIGWLSLFLPLPAFAWLGRLLTWWLLAWSWRRLSEAFVPRPWMAVLTAALFVCFQERAQMAGEWVLGGFEAKGFAYVLVFLGLSMLVRDRWNATLLCFGAGAAFHVLVGGWSVVAAAIAWCWAGKERPSLLRIWPGLLGGLLLSLPGLWPALQLNAGVDSETAQAAASIYVFERLPHHLVPQSFSRPAVLRHVLLAVAFLVLWFTSPSGGATRRLFAFVGGAVLIAAAGALLALATASDRDLYAALMRYYWFRLSDVMLPLGVSLGAARHIAALARLRPKAGALWLGVAWGLAAFHLAGYVLDRPFPTRPRADKANKIADYAAWRHLTAWVRQNTPENALFLTPRSQQTFKWYTGRGEVVTWKDLPQNAQDIVEWWRRMNEIHAADGESDDLWIDSLTELSAERLRELGQRYEADYLVTHAQPRLALPLVYQNNSYAVYRLD